MSLLFKVSLGFILMLFGLDSPNRKFDEFGDINCEDEMARLDNFALQLLAETQPKGAVIYYGGKTFRGRLPRKGESTARAARLKYYLVHRRGVPADRVIVINGGYAEEWHAELWVVTSRMPAADPYKQIKGVKFRKGRAHPRAFRCQI